MLSQCTQPREEGGHTKQMTKRPHPAIIGSLASLAPIIPINTASKGTHEGRGQAEGAGWGVRGVGQQQKGLAWAQEA